MPITMPLSARIGIASYYKPYDDAVTHAIGHVHQATSRAPVLFSLHSFTPIWRGHPRPWHAGVLWDKRPAPCRSADRGAAEPKAI
jgi:predicted N-formylglutamate amidohydrolase